MRHTNYENNSCGIIIEMKLTALDINISGKNIIKNNIFNKIRSVKLFIVCLLNLIKSNCNNICKMLAHIIRSLKKNSIFGMNGIAESLIGAAVNTGLQPRKNTCGNNAFSNFSDLAEFRTGNNRAALIHNADITIKRISHLIYNALKQSVWHVYSPY